jgi:hypothetical protein
MAKNRDVWTDGQLALLQGMWNLGYSASEIAERLQNKTRNAVMGKVSRLRKAGLEFMEGNERPYIKRSNNLFKPWSKNVVHAEDIDDFFNPATFNERPR